MFNWNSFDESEVIYLFSTITAILLIFLCVREFRKSNALKNIFLTALFFKLACGIGVGLLYSQYYTSGDTFVFFSDGEIIANLLIENPIQFFQFLWDGNPDFEIWGQLSVTQPRALFFSKVTAVGYILSFGNYWALAILFSVLSFLAAWNLVKVITVTFARAKIAGRIAFLFFPSVVFWTSGLMKETIAMTGFYILASVFIKGWTQRKVNSKDVLTFVLGFWLLWNLKYYFAGLLLVIICSLVLVNFILSRTEIKNVVAKVTLFFIVLLFPLLLVTFLHPNFYPHRILDVVIKNYEAYRVISSPENLITYYHLQATPFSMTINSPWALFSSLFRPFLWEAKSFVSLVSGVENLLVLILFIGALWNFKIAFKSPNRILILGIVTYITLLAIFLALSTPNLGTLVRYRVGFYPLFVLLLILGNPWIERRLQKIIT